jgi:hypothetical protein
MHEASCPEKFSTKEDFEIVMVYVDAVIVFCSFFP